jgi:hypothetical protein
MLHPEEVRRLRLTILQAHGLSKVQYLQQRRRRTNLKVGTAALGLPGAEPKGLAAGFQALSKASAWHELMWGQPPSAVQRPGRIGPQFSAHLQS